MKTNEYVYVRKCFMFEGLEYVVYGKDEEDATIKKVKLLDDLKRGRPVRQHAKDRAEATLSPTMTVSQFAETWINVFILPKVRPAGEKKQKNTIAKKTYNSYIDKLDGYILPSIGKMKLSKVRDIDIQKILNASKNAGLSKSHCEKVRIVLNMMFNQAVNSRLIEYNPVATIVVTASEGKKRRSLTSYERRILKIVAKTHRCGLWILFLLATGIRPAESAPLRVKDVDFKKGVVHIYQAIESGTENVIGPPKSDAGNREVPIACIREEIAKYVEGRDPEEFLFPQTDGKKMMTTTAIANNWRSFRRQMDLEMGAETTSHGHIYDPKDVDDNGVPLYPDDNGNPKNGHKVADDLVLYCLRHTFCTDLQKAGIPLNTARVLMGHEDIKITAQIYTHTDSDDVAEAGEMLNRYRQGREEAESVA